jgi:hypothetical protein
VTEDQPPQWSAPQPARHVCCDGAWTEGSQEAGYTLPFGTYGCTCRCHAPKTGRPEPTTPPEGVERVTGL